MSCPQTEQWLTSYLGDELDHEARSQFEQHMTLCDDCRRELSTMSSAHSALRSWREEPLPEWGWSRMQSVYALQGASSATKPATRPRASVTWWQWLPTAASFAMLILLLVDTRVIVNDEGVTVAFGGQAALLEREETQQLLARFEQRQDENSIALMQAALTQARESSESTFQQLFTYFEQQRQRDMQDVRASYEQLVNSDYETVRSLQQLANFVTFNESGL